MTNQPTTPSIVPSFELTRVRRTSRRDRVEPEYQERHGQIQQPSQDPSPSPVSGQAQLSEINWDLFNTRLEQSVDSGYEENKYGPAGEASPRYTPNR